MMEDENPGVEQLLLASSPGENWTKRTAAKMLSSCSWRITEKDGVYICEEILGTGEVLSYKFELGKEFVFTSTERGEFATSVVTGDGNGSFLMVAQDKKSGVVSEFKFHVDGLGLTGTWSIPATGESSKLRYMRVGDCHGSFKLVSRSDGYQTYLDALGLTENEKVQMQDMFSSYYLKHTGGGVWATGVPGVIESMNIKFGEEFTYEMLGKKCTEVLTHNRDGYLSVQKMEDKVVVFKIKCGKQFQIVEFKLEGVPGTLTTFVYVRA